jgi:hypothetical protein
MTCCEDENSGACTTAAAVTRKNVRKYNEFISMQSNPAAKTDLARI